MTTCSNGNVNDGLMSLLAVLIVLILSGTFVVLSKQREMKMNPKKLKAWYLPQSTHDALLEVTHQYPKLTPGEIIEMALQSLSERANREVEE